MTFHDEKRRGETSKSLHLYVFIFSSRVGMRCFFGAQWRLLLRTFPRINAWCTLRMMKKWSVYFHRAKAGHIADTYVGKYEKLPANSRAKFRLALNSTFSLFTHVSNPRGYFSLSYILLLDFTRLVRAYDILPSTSLALIIDAILSRARRAPLRSGLNKNTAPARRRNAHWRKSRSRNPRKWGDRVRTSVRVSAGCILRVSYTKCFRHRIAFFSLL